MDSINQAELCSGVNFYAISTKKFKTNRISINLIVPMDNETVSANALLSYVMRLGCKAYPDFSVLNKKLDEFYGAGLGTDALKMGSNQIINFSITYMDDRFCLSNENITKECGKLLLSVVTEPLIENGSFPQNQVEIEKENLIEAIGALINDKRNYAVSQCLKMIGRGDRAYIPRYGKVEDVKALDGEKIAKAYETLLKTAQVEIFCTGNGDFESLKDDFRTAFSKFDRTSAGITPTTFISAGEDAISKTETKDVAQSKLVLAFRPTCDITNQKEQIAMKVMSSLFGGTPASKLFLNVREKLSLCYYCAARYNPVTKILLVDSGVEKDNVKAAGEQIITELQNIKDGKFTETETENTKKLLINSLNTVVDIPSAMEDWHFRELVEGDRLSPTDTIKAIENITYLDIKNAASKMELDGIYLLTENEEAEKA